MSKTHDFTERLEWSASLDDEAAWGEFYRSIWPDLGHLVSLQGKSVWQSRGVDRVVYLANGREVYVDEKKREPRKNAQGKLFSYDDFLCEEWSVANYSRATGKIVGRKIGWTLDRDKHCDAVAYAIPFLGKAYFLPFDLLRLTAEVNLPRWKTLCRQYPIAAENKGYTTINCAVTWDQLFKDMRQQMHRCFGGPLQLPLPAEVQEAEPLDLFAMLPEEQSPPRNGEAAPERGQYDPGREP